METSGEVVAQISGQQRKRKRKRPSKCIGPQRKGASRRYRKNQQPAVKEVVPNVEKPKSLRAQLYKEPSTRINEIISEKERKEIESHYYLDLTFVDKRKVKKSIFVGDRIFRCRLCQTAYSRLDKCQVHVWRHFNMLPYVCYACDFKTLTVTNIRSHVRKFHLKLKPFKCEQCEKSYSEAALLKEHMVTHTRTEPYRCDYCGFAGVSKRVLISHMTKHKPEKDIFCDICGKAFYSNPKMRAHRNKHEESNAIKCDICFAYVSSENALRRHHINVHTRDYICNICMKKCTTRKALHNHVYQVHSDGRHQCPMCPNVYKNGSMLQDHILKHQGIRKYNCNVCGKAFAQRTHVATHMAVHDGKRYECPGCHKAFNRQDNMKMHTKNCAQFLADPELVKLLPARKVRASKNTKTNEPILNDSETVNITIQVEPTLNPDINIKIEPLDESE